MSPRYCAVFGLSLLLIPVRALFGQDSHDPLSEVRDLSDNREIFISWVADSAGIVSTQVLDVGGGPDYVPETKGSGFHGSGVSDSTRLAVATGNFLGGARKHPVVAWIGHDDSIHLAIPDLATDLTWSNTHELTYDGPVADHLDLQQSPIRLATGDFFGETLQDEIVLAYQRPDYSIQFEIVDFNETSLVPRARGSFTSVPMVADSVQDTSPAGQWDIATGDFDGDQNWEVALLYHGDTGERCTNNCGSAARFIGATIYDVAADGSLTVSLSHERNVNSYPIPDGIKDIAAAAGDFDEDPWPEIALGITGPSFATGHRMHVLDLDGGAIHETFILAGTAPFVGDIIVGDFSGDGRDDILWSSTGAILTVDNDLIPVWVGSFSSSTTNAGIGDYQYAAADLTGDGRLDLLEFEQRTSRITASTIEGFPDAAVRSEPFMQFDVFTTPEDNQCCPGRRAIAVGDFNGDRRWRGRAVRTTRPGVVLPSVVLNAPPVHYDILEGIEYDLSGCFPSGSCGFSSQYKQASSTAATVSIQTHSDWGVSKSLEANAEIKLKADAKYGEKFSKTAESGDTKTISTERTASVDDWIYATLTDIDYYEYPVFEGSDPTPIGYYLVSIPTNQRTLWMESKDDLTLGNRFRPNHEVGNILSYRAADTDDLAATIVDFPEQTVGSTGSSGVSLRLTTFEQEGAQESWDSSFETGREIGAKFDIYGVELGLTSSSGKSYSRGEVTTQTVRVESSLEVAAALGNLAQEFGTAATYQVTPYAYWTQYGALAIDYKVSIPTDPGTFWQEKYGGKTDLAFSLPWRHDPQKGHPFPANDESYGHRTRDIVLNDNNPRAGTTVLIGARVRNMGLASVTVPVTVDFYLGDPAAGGTLIASNSTAGNIASQSSEDVFVEWAIPPNEPLLNRRIYVEIDAADQVTSEVHETNNLGWAPVLGLGASSVSIDPSRPLPERSALRQNYPNPVNQITTFTYALAASGHVSLKIYDLLGREAHVVTSGHRSSGEHATLFDASSLASGVYFFRLEAGGYVETKRMVVVK